MDNLKDYRTVTLHTIAGGVSKDLFDGALQEVLDSIENPDIATKPKRKITLEYEFQPSEDREHAIVAVTVKTKIPPGKPVGATVFLGRDKDGVHAYEHNLKQSEMSFDEVKQRKVVPMKGDE